MRFLRDLPTSSPRRPPACFSEENDARALLCPPPHFHGVELRTWRVLASRMLREGLLCPEVRPQAMALVLAFTAHLRAAVAATAKRRPGEKERLAAEAEQLGREAREHAVAMGLLPTKAGELQRGSGRLDVELAALFKPGHEPVLWP